jgi:hypothetical protein
MLIELRTFGLTTHIRNYPHLSLNRLKLCVSYPTKLMCGSSMWHASETCMSATAQTAVVQIAIFDLPLVIRRLIRSN